MYYLVKLKPAGHPDWGTLATLCYKKYILASKVTMAHIYFSVYIIG